MRNVRSRKLTALGLVALLALAACSSSDDGESSGGGGGGASNPSDESLEPVRIGVVSQEKELVAYPEISFVAQAFEAYVNAERGGIGGHPLEIEVCLSGDRPESNQACMQQFVNDDSVSAVIIGGSDTATARRAAGPVGLPLVVPMLESADGQTEGVYTTDAGALGQGFVFGEYLADSEVGTVSIVCINDSAFQIVCDYTRQGIESKGVTVEEMILVDPETSDFSGVLRSMKADEVDYLVGALTSQQCLPFAEALSSFGIETPVIALDVCPTQQMIESGLIDGWDVVMNSAIVETSETASDEVKEARRVFEEYGSGEPNYYGLAGWMYGSLEVLFDVLTTLGADAVDRASVDEALATYDAVVPTYGPVSCPGPGVWIGQCHPTSLIMTVSDGGYERGSDYFDVTEDFTTTDG